MAKAKTKTRGANLPVPQSRDEAAEAVRLIGQEGRELTRIQADMNDALARIKQEAEAKAAPIRESIETRTEGVKMWAEANRQALTSGGKVKHADLGTGMLRWKFLPPKVTLRDVEGILAKLKRRGLAQFIRVKEEINREAMLADPVVAQSIGGVTIGGDGEEFSIEPFAAELAEVA